MRARKRRRLTAAVALGAWAMVAAAQKATFGDVETVVAVEIPVQVLSNGNPVRGLTRDNFEVLDGRKKSEIVNFEIVDLTMASAPPGRAVAVETEVPAAGRRHFLLLFDLTNSEPAATQRARDAARQLVEESLHPSDLGAVATWSYTKGPKLVMGFTSDRGQIGAAIDTLGLVDLRNRTPDPLGLLLAEIDRSSSISSGSGGAGPGGGIKAEAEAVFIENLREQAANERASARQVKGSELASLTSGFSTLAQLMSSVLGRKYVVLLSQGFDSSLITGSDDTDRERENFSASASGEIWNVNSEERFGNARSGNQLEEMLAVFRRADCAVHSVDIGGLAAGGAAGDVGRRSDRSSLLTMAKGTGGQLYENFNNLGQAMGEMLQATSVTYVLTIQPRDLKLDGKFHDLKVRLVGGPSGANLVHRPGYYPPKPYRAQGGIEKQLDTAQLLIAGEPGGDLVAGVAAAAFRGEGDRGHVPMVVEIDGSPLLGLGSGNALSLSIYSYAFDEAGGVADFVAQSLTLDLGQMGKRLAAEPLKFVADLRLRPGRYSIRTLVRAGEGGSYWLGRTPVEVPAFGSGSLAAVAPLVPAPMTSGLVIRSSSSQEKTQGLAFPFVLGEEFYLPSGLPLLSKGGDLRACLNVYGLDESELVVKGELIGDDGRTVPDAEVRTLSRRGSDQPGLQRLELGIRPGSAASGHYSLRITVEQGGRSSSVSAPLSVGS